MMRAVLAPILATLLAWALFVAPAPAQTATFAGSGSSSANTTTLAVTSVTCAAGDILAVAAASSSQAPASASDGHNSYALGNVIAESTTLYGAWLHAEMTTALSSATVTITYAGNSSAKTAVIWCLAGVYALDVNGSGVAAASGTSASLATGTLGSASEVVLGFLANSSSISGYSATGLTNAGTPVAAAPYLNSSYQVASATTAITYAPSWTTSRANVVNLISFEAGSPPAGGKTCTLALMGVGPC
jgi:hypothetical protein